MPVTQVLCMVSPYSPDRNPGDTLLSPNVLGTYFYYTSWGRLQNGHNSSLPLCSVTLHSHSHQEGKPIYLSLESGFVLTLANRTLHKRGCACPKPWPQEILTTSASLRILHIAMKTSPDQPVGWRTCGLAAPVIPTDSLPGHRVGPPGSLQLMEDTWLGLYKTRRSTLLRLSQLLMPRILS